MARGNLYQPVTIPVPDPANANQSFLKIMGNVRVTVKVAGTNSNAAIFQSRNPAETTPTANPFTTSTGVINIWAEYGEYDVTFSDLVTPSRFTDQTFGWSSAPAGDDSIPTAKLAEDAGIVLPSFAAAVQNMLFKTGDLKMTLESISADPDGWVRSIGQNVSRTGAYAALFAKLGTRYGTGDGSTTFGLPDLRGRFVLGAGTGSNLSNRSLGDTGGAEAVTLGISAIPAHAHGVNDGGHSHTGSTGAAGAHAHTVGGGTPVYNTSAGGAGSVNLQGGSNFTLYRQAFAADAVGDHAHTVSISSSGTGVSIQNNGGGGSHENMPPFAVANWLIKL